MPLPLFSGKWTFAGPLNREELDRRQMRLRDFATVMNIARAQGNLLLDADTEAFLADVQNGLVFESDIPQGYGVGSSGALTAAVLATYGTRNQDYSPAQLKSGFAQLEGFFHGTSSGTDPLVCFLQKTILLGGVTGIQILEENHSSILQHFFLLDTGESRHAEPFITWFLGKSTEPAFRRHCDTQFLPAVSAAISGFLENNFEALFENTHRIAEFQMQHLEPLIYPKFKEVWQEGLSGNLFKLKLCGAGGGGFILGIAQDVAAVKQHLSSYKILPIHP
jgi:mevalonate kinase